MLNTLYSNTYATLIQNTQSDRLMVISNAITKDGAEGCFRITLNQDFNYFVMSGEMKESVKEFFLNGLVKALNQICGDDDDLFAKLYKEGKTDFLASDFYNGLED